jgi:DNA polymerase-3 subunit beta
MALVVVSKGIASNSTIPILSGILLRAQEGTLELQTTDLTISIVIRYRHILKSGRNSSHRADPHHMVKRSGCRCDVEETPQGVPITCDKSIFRLHTLDAAVFNDYPPLEPERSIEWPVLPRTDGQ